MTSKIINAVMITAVSAVAFTSCKKDQNPPINPTIEDWAYSSNIAIEGIPDTLRVPEGNRLVADGFARGFQIYQVKRSATNCTIGNIVHQA